MNKKMKKNKIFLVIPKLIKQPTWGGNYILNLKKWSKSGAFCKLKIGQSYELYSGSWLRTDLKSSADNNFIGALGEADKPDEITYHGEKNKLIALSDLIADNPVGVLGEIAMKKYQGKMNLLIKFTQAKDNSFQLHIGQKYRSNKWRPKPESWYYFKPGLITIGLKPNIDMEEYRQTIQKIDRELRKLSALVINGEIRLTQAKKMASAVIKKNNPWRFVNRLKVNRNEVIDLSEGGLHHSWEEDVRRFPLGNVLYELQLDVMDPVSTIRCFDKGKFKPDGSLRELEIEEYFKHLDSDACCKHPTEHRQKPIMIFSDESIRIESLISNRYYCLDKIYLRREYSGPHAVTGPSFHHLFVKSGAVQIQAGKEKLILTAGHSCLLLATAGSYRLKPMQRKVEILKSYIA